MCSNFVFCAVIDLCKPDLGVGRPEWGQLEAYRGDSACLGLLSKLDDHGEESMLHVVVANL